MFQPASPSGSFDLDVKQGQGENITIVFSLIKVDVQPGLRTEQTAADRGGSCGTRGLFSLWTKD